MSVYGFFAKLWWKHYGKARTGRTLAPAELTAMDNMNLDIGYDTDNEDEAPIQRCHIVATYPISHPICGATSLWFHGSPEGVSDCINLKITCKACLDRLPDYVEWYERDPEWYIEHTAALRAVSERLLGDSWGNAGEVE